MKTITIDTARFKKLISIESFKTKKGKFSLGEKILISDFITNETRQYEIITVIPIDDFIDRIRVKRVKFD